MLKPHELSDFSLTRPRLNVSLGDLSMLRVGLDRRFVDVHPPCIEIHEQRGGIDASRGGIDASCVDIDASSGDRHVLHVERHR